MENKNKITGKAKSLDNFLDILENEINKSKYELTNLNIVNHKPCKCIYMVGSHIATFNSSDKTFWIMLENIEETIKVKELVKRLGLK
ncbi:MAG: hypothetical protein HRU03_01545 [Nanoarchaeales archaeon]|nr:hypothetical protein [Nanoarchaeales archaeon]